MFEVISNINGEPIDVGHVDFLSGVSEGTIVAVCLPQSVSLAQVLSVCFDRKLIAVPIDPATPDVQIDFICEHSGADVLLSVNGIQHLAHSDREVSFASGTCFLVYTSGSTGAPKGVMLSRKAVEANARALAREHKFERGHGTMLPLYHCNALMMSLVGCMLTDNPLLLLDSNDLVGSFELCQSMEIRTISMAPRLLQRLIHAAPAWPRDLAYVITAAAPLTNDLAKAFHRLYGGRLRQGYGLTEAVNFSLLMPMLTEAEFILHYIQESRPPVGTPLEGTSARIVNGELQVKGPNIMEGYYRNPEETKTAITDDGWLRTGDLAEFSNGYYKILGRLKEVIKKGGRTIYPLDVDEHFMHQMKGRSVCSFSLSPATEHEDIGVAIDAPFCSDDLSIINREKNFQPAAVWWRSIPRTSTGKPQRRSLSKALTHRTRTGELYEILEQEVLRCLSRAPVNALLNSPDPRLRYIGSTIEKLQRDIPFSQQSRILEQGSSAIEALELLFEELSNGATNASSGEERMQIKPGLWNRLMMEWPMGDYGRMCADFVNAQSIKYGRVLEIGAGVGNTSKYIQLSPEVEYVRSDVSERILQRYHGDVPHAVFDIDSKLEIGRFTCILGTNVVHCAKDKAKTLETLFDLLEPNGILVLAEGSPYPKKNSTEWCLNPLYGFFNGWWNRGGFLDRATWLELLSGVGCIDIGYAVNRCGSYDLGGLVFGRKPN